MAGDAKQHPVQVGRVPARDDCGCYGLAPLTAQRLERVFEEAERPTLDARVEVAAVLLGALRALVGEALEAGERAGHAAKALEAQGELPAALVAGLHAVVHGLDGVAHELVPAADLLVGELRDAALVVALAVDGQPQHVLAVLHVADGLGKVAPAHVLACSEVLSEAVDGADVAQDLDALALELVHAVLERTEELLAVVKRLRLLDLREREAEVLEGEDAIEALLVVAGVQALVLLAFGAGVEQALLVVVLDGAHGHAHAAGELANCHQAVFICRHAASFSHV